MISRTASLGVIAICAPLTVWGGASPPDTALDGFVTVGRLPVPENAFLALGRDVWGDTCENCHGGNKYTGAPKITLSEDWAPRVEKGMQTLVQHAITGFTGPRYTQMPARGGNAGLSDHDVAAAVAFMVWASGGAATATAYATTISTMGQ